MSDPNEANAEVLSIPDPPMPAELLTEPPEAEVQTEEPAAPVAIPLTRVEQIAARHGWRPDGRVDAVEFLDSVPNYREGLVNKLKTADSEIGALYDALALKVTADAARDKIAKRAGLADAVRRGDEEEALRLAEELAQPVAVPQRQKQAAPDDAIVAWADANPWIMQDKDMAIEAGQLYDIELARRGGDDNPVAILKVVENKMRRLYPEAVPDAPRNDPPPPREIRTNANRSLPGTTTPNGVRPTSARSSPLDSLDIETQRAVLQYREMGLSDDKIAKSLAKLKGTR